MKSAPITIVFVDHCYGEFLEKLEPTDVGLTSSSAPSSKPAAAFAQTGGYIAGGPISLSMALTALTSPGIGREAGCSLIQSPEPYHGAVLCAIGGTNAVKVSCFASALLQELGFQVVYLNMMKLSHRYHRGGSFRGCGEDDRLLCQGIQKKSPVSTPM